MWNHVLIPQSQWRLTLAVLEAFSIDCTHDHVPCTGLGCLYFLNSMVRVGKMARGAWLWHMVVALAHSAPLFVGFALLVCHARLQPRGHKHFTVFSIVASATRRQSAGPMATEPLDCASPEHSVVDIGAYRVCLATPAHGAMLCVR